MSRVRVNYKSIELPLTIGTSWFEADGVLFGTKMPKTIGLGSRAAIKHDICVDETHAGPPYRSGGPLDVRHYSNDRYNIVNTGLYVSGYNYYEGGFVPASNPANYLDWTDPQSSMLDDSAWVNPNYVTDGATGWNKAKPDISQAESLVFAGEGPEIPTMLKSTAKNFHHIWKDSGGHRRNFGPRDLADNWLNLNFGWVPFLSDINKLYELTVNFDKALKQLRRDNRQWKYARRTVRKDSNFDIPFEQQGSVGHSPALVSSFYNSPNGYSRLERRDTLNVWFVGRFRYYMPELKVEGPASMWEMATLYGLKPSPTAIWELTPWSWLIDWWTNFGRITDNLWSVINEGVCSKYAYVMSHRKQQVTGEFFTNLKDTPVSSVAYATSEQKVRAPADPFGFGLNANDFSNRQWSILSALGMSKQTILSR